MKQFELYSFVRTAYPGPSPQEKRFAAYLEGLAKAAGHRDRENPLKDYCRSLLLPVERKSIEPMAARLLLDRVQAARQSLQHLVSAPWSDEAALKAPLSHQEPVRRNAHRRVMMKPAPRAALEVPQPEILLQLQIISSSDAWPAAQALCVASGGSLASQYLAGSAPLGACRPARVGRGGDLRRTRSPASGKPSLPG